jgi:hypothetical protein
MIIRTSRKNRFTHIPNDLIEDPSLDWKDLGLLVFLLSKPDNWEISVEHLKKQRKLGRDGIYKCLDTLIFAGYAIREKNKDGTVDWYIFDEKTTEKPEIKPNTEKPEKAKESQIRKSRKCDSEAKSGKAVIRESRNTGNPTQVNTELNKQELKKEETKTEVKKESATIPEPEKKFTLPDCINVRAWDEFEQHRKEIRKPLTDLARTKALNQLKDLTKDEQQEIIDYSITGRYPGLYPERIKQKSLGPAVNRTRGFKQPQPKPDYSVLGGNFIDSTAKVIN